MSEQLSVLSYNILYPNTEGWWIYKYYPAHTPRALSAWPARRALLLRQLKLADSDILCLQETASASFDQDFEALKGEYDHVMHARGMRMRVSTFWRKSRLKLIAEKHKYRTLLTLLRSQDTQRSLLVINVHLSGGPRPKERVEQVAQALSQGEKLWRQHRSSEEPMRVIICGDFNMDLAQSELESFLRTGALGPEAREPDYPETSLTKKGKRHDFGPIVDTVSALRDILETSELTNPTLTVPNLIHRFCQPLHDQPLSELERSVLQARETSLEAFSAHLRPDFYEAARVLFERFADLVAPADDQLDESTEQRDRLRMSHEGARRWLEEMNGGWRGSESRAWERLTEQSGQPSLSFSAWSQILIAELYAGKWWSVAYDLEMSGASLPPLPQGSPALHCERLDHILFGGALSPTSWCRGALFDELEELRRAPRPLPDLDHPSDHIPVGATFELS